MTDLKIGIEEIDRKYEILEKMTEGGMGEIFKARHRLLEEVRVIKTIHAEHRESAFHRAASSDVLLAHVAPPMDRAGRSDATASR